MEFVSTRGAAARVGFSQALSAGLAADGGLYVPATWPVDALKSVSADARLAEVGAIVLPRFADGDALQPMLPAICEQAFNFPVPLIALDAPDALSVLELFHGPTAAFKDFGARFLAASLTRIRAGAARPLHILVATSGDTGGAVAAAFHRQPGILVSVLFPKGLVSPTQERQLTCWGDNVRSYAVRGSFDDCQRMVKQAFLEPALRERHELSSANSINLGRLLPQSLYYIAASLQVQARSGKPASFIIPSGNLGNSTAALWARRLGAPIDRIVLAHNANRTVPDYLDTGVLKPRASVATLACSMDVGDPSNLERVRSLVPDVEALRAQVTAYSVDDAAIRARIQSDAARFGRVWCPHTATAAEVYTRLSADERSRHSWVLVATAHPAKFREVIAPLVAQPLVVPENLARLFERPSRYDELAPTLAALREVLEKS